VIWNFGDIFEALLEVLPKEHPALIHGNETISWHQLDRRSKNILSNLYDHGAKAGDRVCFYMRNRAEYMEMLVACFRGRLTHVNVNYRYVADEIRYILDNSEATVVVYAEEFRPNIRALKSKLPQVKQWIEISDHSKATDATRYEVLTHDNTAENLLIDRSPQ